MKCTPVQALRLCTGRTANRGSRGIALLFLGHGTRRGEESASRPGRSLPRERPGIHCTGGWVGPIAFLDRCGKPCPPPGFSFYYNTLFYMATNKQRTKTFPHLFLIVHHIYDDVRAPCNWRIRRRHASRTPHTQHDTFLGRYGLTVV